MAPHRFGFFATLPLPDVDDALAEVEYALDTLHADGIVLLSNYAGRYPGDPAFEPLFTELNRRKSVIFFHPTAAIGAGIPLGNNAGATLPGASSALLEFVFDTTRAVTDLLLHGTLEHTPAVRSIIPHAGGAIPSLAPMMVIAALWKAGRMAAGATWGPEMDQQQILAQLAQMGVGMSQLQRLFYDTAFSDSSSAFPSLLALSDPTHLLFGSDYPWAGEAIASLLLARLESYQGLEVGERAKISRDNALSLFPRLASVYGLQAEEVSRP